MFIISLFIKRQIQILHRKIAQQASQIGLFRKLIRDSNKSLQKQRNYNRNSTNFLLKSSRNSSPISSQTSPLTAATTTNSYSSNEINSKPTSTATVNSDRFWSEFQSFERIRNQIFLVENERDQLQLVGIVVIITFN